MSITNPKIFWKGDTAKLEFQSGLVPKRSRTNIWVCTTDATNAIDVVKQFQAASTTPFLGDALDGDLSSYLKSMRADKADGTQDAWYVTLDYSPRDEDKQQQPDENGNMTSDPLQWREELSISFSRITVPVYEATYRGGYVGGAAELMQPGVKCMPCNSAFIPFNPGLEREIALRHIRFGKWKLDVDGERFQDIQNRVNNAEFKINKPLYNFKDKWRQYTARIMNAGGVFQLVNEVKVWKTEAEVVIHPDTWRVMVPDRGIAVRAIPAGGEQYVAGGDPDGEGGTIPAQSDENGNPVPPRRGTTYHRNQQDHQYTPIPEPVLFDGDGQPLAPGKPTVYITFSVFPEGPFAGIGAIG